MAERLPFLPGLLQMHDARRRQMIILSGRALAGLPQIGLKIMLVGQPYISLVDTAARTISSSTPFLNCAFIRPLLSSHCSRRWRPCRPSAAADCFRAGSAFLLGTPAPVQHFTRALPLRKSVFLSFEYYIILGTVYGQVLFFYEFLRGKRFAKQKGAQFAGFLWNKKQVQK